MANPEVAIARALIEKHSLRPEMSLEEMRKVYDECGTQFPNPPDVTVRTDQFDGVQGEWTSTPATDQTRVVLYLHGGGFAMGSNLSHRHAVAQLGRDAGARTLMPLYKLMPEYRFPAALDDCLAAYRFLLSSGFAPSRIAVAGDSCGGNLTVATLIAARDAGLPQPSCGVCMSPWVDMEVTGASIESKAAEDFMVQKQPLLKNARSYLRGVDGRAHTDPRHPLASPIHADLTGLAPLLIQVGSAETLLDDAVRLTASAGAHGVETRLEVWPEMFHTWHLYFPILGEGRRALKVAGDFIRDRMDRAARARTIPEECNS
ncbi:MAG: alpha/beta hydrolase [Burkholderiales bacterium]